MFAHGVPWQTAVTVGFLYSIGFVGLLLVALATAVLELPSLIAGIALLVALGLLLVLIPLFMNLSRTFFGTLLGFLASHGVVTILTYGIVYHLGGLSTLTGEPTGIGDALYLSVTTWTTLGADEFLLPPQVRTASAFEAMLGLLSFALSTSLLWLWCTENMVPPDQAFMDGYRRHRTSFAKHRMRIWTLSGKQRELSEEWVDPAGEEALRWNPENGTWEPVPRNWVPDSDSRVMAAVKPKRKEKGSKRRKRKR